MAHFDTGKVSKAASDVATTIANGSATTNDCLLAAANAFDCLFAMSSADRDTVVAQWPAMLAKVRAKGISGPIRTPGGSLIVY